MSIAGTIQFSDAAAEWVISRCDAERLLALVHGDPAVLSYVCRGGFKATIKNLQRPALRRRLALALTKNSSWAELVLEDPEGPWWTAMGALLTLNDNWLLTHWRSLLRSLDGRCLAVAMAMFKNFPEIRERGVRLLRRDGFWRSGESGATADLPEALMFFCGAARGSAADEAVASPDDTGQVQSLRRELASVREALARQREKVKTLEQSSREAVQEYEEREKCLRKELRAVKQELAALEADVPLRVARGVEAARRRLLDRSPLRDEEMGEALVPSDNVLEKIEAVLAAQEKLNASFGTRQAMRRRLQRLCEGAEQLEACIEESVRLHPEVRRLHAAVCREIDRLHELIGEKALESRAPALSAQIAATIRATPPEAGGFEEIKQVQRLLAEPLVGELLGPEEHERLTEMLEQRRRLLFGMLQQENPPTTESSSGDEIREIWDVAAELRRLPPGAIEVFIDGYNVIKGVEPLAHLEEKNGLAAGRDELCRLCGLRADRFAHLEIVFDGIGALSSREVRDGVTVVFSNGLGESQNADDYLVERLSTERAADHIRWLVSNDRGLQARTEAGCDAVVRAEDWYAFLCSL